VSKRCVLCGDPVSGFAAERDDRGVMVMAALRQPGPYVCLWCLPEFVARGGRMKAEAVGAASVGEEVDGG